MAAIGSLGQRLAHPNGYVEWATAPLPHRHRPAIAAPVVLVLCSAASTGSLFRENRLEYVDSRAKAARGFDFRAHRVQIAPNPWIGRHVM